MFSNLIKIFEVLAKGGWVMAPIILGSVIGLALFVERLLALKKSRVSPAYLMLRLRRLILTDKLDDARRLCEAHKSALARIALVALEHEGKDRWQIKTAVEEVGQREAYGLERGVGALGAVASVEPLMGLLGTVLGMITAFQRVELGGVGDPRLVAQGVWVALLTTAAGLIVAIPCYIGYRFLLGRVERMVVELEEDAITIVDDLVALKEGETVDRTEELLEKARSAGIGGGISPANHPPPSGRDSEDGGEA